MGIGPFIPIAAAGAACGIGVVALDQPGSERLAGGVGGRGGDRVVGVTADAHLLDLAADHADEDSGRKLLRAEAERPAERAGGDEGIVGPEGGIGVRLSRLIKDIIMRDRHGLQKSYDFFTPIAKLRVR